MTTPTPRATGPSTEVGDDGMRLKNRIIWVLLSVAVYLLCIRAMVSPSLNRFLTVGDVPLYWAIPWFILAGGLALQMSAKARAGGVGVLWLILLMAPMLTGFAAREVYTQFSMERTTATVVEARKPFNGGPIPLTLRFPDGTVADGYSTIGEGRKDYVEYTIPNKGQVLDVVRDPAGRVPARTAFDDEALPAGTSTAIRWGVFGGATTLLTLGVCVSVLTRKVSFITDTARKVELDKAGDPPMPPEPAVTTPTESRDSSRAASGARTDGADVVPDPTRDAILGDSDADSDADNASAHVPDPTRDRTP